MGPEPTPSTTRPEILRSALRVDVGPCMADLDNNGVLIYDGLDVFIDSFLAGCG